MTIRDLQRVDLNLLVTFDVLMTERSVTRAAARMQLGQPAMSASLARLRRLFDDPLLVREGRTLVPTPVAESLIVPVRQALVLLEAALNQGSSFDATTEKRTFTILASDYVLVVLLRPLLANLRREAPDVRIVVRALTDDYADLLRRGLFDLFIAPRELERSGVRMDSEDLFDDRLVCAVDAGNTEVGAVITEEQFLRLPYVGYQGEALPTSAQQQLHAMGIDRSVDVATQSFVATTLLLRDTPFFTIIHERLALSLGAQSGIRILAPPVEFAPLTEAMYWAPRHTDSPAHRWLRQRVRESAAELRNHQPE